MFDHRPRGLKLPIALIDVFAITLLIVMVNEPQFYKLQVYDWPTYGRGKPLSKADIRNAAARIEIEQDGSLLLDGREMKMDDIIRELEPFRGSDKTILIFSKADKDGNGRLVQQNSLLVAIAEMKIGKCKLVDRQKRRNPAESKDVEL